jgi:hypothetical protein
MSTTAVTPEAVDLIIVLPSRLFGGAERTITNLIEGMAQLPSGPRVTVFAYAEMFAPHLSADSGVTLVDMAPWGLVGRLQGLRALRRDAATLADQVVRHSTPTRKAVVLCFLHYGAALAVWIKRELKGLPHLRVIASPRGAVGGRHTHDDAGPSRTLVVACTHGDDGADLRCSGGAFRRHAP